MRRAELFAIFLVVTSLALPGSSFSACIVDDTGVEVCLEGKPSRAISLYGAFTETIWELGGGSALIARTKNDNTIAELEPLPVVGTGLRPNIEYLMALRPQLIISRSGKSSGETLSMMRQRGLVVAAFDPRTLDELYSVIERIGVLWGLSGEAQTLAGGMRARFEEIIAVTAKVKERPGVVYEIRAEPLTVAGTSGIVDAIITAAGAVQLVKNDKKLLMLDIEELMNINPDYYIIQRGPMNKNPLPPAERTHHSKLKAVREERIFYVDEKVFSRPGPRVAEAAETLSRFIFPELWKR